MSRVRTFRILAVEAVRDGMRRRFAVVVALINLGKSPFVVEPKMRIAQMIVAPVSRAAVEEVDDLESVAHEAIRCAARHQEARDGSRRVADLDRKGDVLILDLVDQVGGYRHETPLEAVRGCGRCGSVTARPAATTRRSSLPDERGTRCC